ncbi:MAG: helix-turn-helix domain-containing protein [Actinomycetota bacterium]|nr:helix-turn-helix domain-containing protein [Actinomycetota bacterium]
MTSLPGRVTASSDGAVPVTMTLRRNPSAGAGDGVTVGSATPVASGPTASSEPSATRHGEALTDAEFSAAVSAVTSAFGDPTRRRIYLHVREGADGTTASEVALRFDLHSNVARHHLDKLVAGGYVEVYTERPAGGGVGRPSKRYRASKRAVGVEAPRRTDDLLVLLLGRALALVPAEDAECMAEEVGEDYGRLLASQMGTSGGQRSFRAALHAIADTLTAHGFAAHADAREDSVALIRDSCPFFDTAQQHPVICAVDRGMVRGMLAGLYGEAVPALESSRALGDVACVTVV